LGNAEYGGGEALFISEKHYNNRANVAIIIEINAKELLTEKIDIDINLNF